MQHVKELITQRQVEFAEPTESKSNELSEKHIALFWERMTMIYGHKWISNYGEMDDNTWRIGLRDLTFDQIKNGIVKCRDRIPVDGQKDWPPTLPEFRAMCIFKHAAPCHRQFSKSLARPPANQEVVKQEIEKMRQALHGVKF